MPRPGEHDSDGNNYRYMPRSPDPTTLTSEAVERATEIFRRELISLRETLETRLDGADADRGRIWDRLRELPGLYETFTTHLRDELIQRDLQNSELTTQRLNDIDTARHLSRQQDADMHAAMRDEAKTAGQSLRELTGQRLSAMDLAAQVLARGIEKFPSDLDRAIGGLREVLTGDISQVQAVSEEKFTAVDALFASNALALTAALAAQEKAVAEQNRSNTLAISKSESSTKETIAANATQAQTGLGSLSDQFADLKERVVRIESAGAGVAAHRSESREERGLQHGSVQLAIAAVAILISAVAVIITLVLHK